MPFPAVSVLWPWEVTFRGAWSEDSRCTAWYGMCESSTVALWKSKSSATQHGMGTAWSVWRVCSLLETYKKGKAVMLQAWSGPEGSRKLRFPDFMTMAPDCGKVVSLMHRRLYPQEIHLVLISFRGWVDPRAVVWPEGLCHWKIPMTPSGIEPATCRFVVQRLNHYATARPMTLCIHTKYNVTLDRICSSSKFISVKFVVLHVIWLHCIVTFSCYPHPRRQCLHGHWCEKQKS